MGQAVPVNRRRKGFSLLELVAVVTLIGVVSAAVIMRLQSIDNTTAKENTAKEEVVLLQNSVERYRFDHGRFPDSFADLVQGGYLAKAPTSLDPGKDYHLDTDTGLVDYH